MASPVAIPGDGDGPMIGTSSASSLPESFDKDTDLDYSVVRMRP